MKDWMPTVVARLQEVSLAMKMAAELNKRQTPTIRYDYCLEGGSGKYLVVKLTLVEVIKKGAARK